MVQELVAKFARAERRACRLLLLGRSTCRYESTRRDDMALRQQIRAIAQARPRFGYRRISVTLKREGLGYSRRSPIIEADLSLNGAKVVAALERAAKHFGYPRATS